jgi:SAM-dependent methyltransferase
MTRRLRDGEDAYGQLMVDWFEGRPAAEMVEREDGLIQANRGPLAYFLPFRRWAAPERRGLRWVRGRVLDAGCGPGRVALELQARGHEVVGIDLSPLAVQVARARGVRDARVLPLDEVGPELGVFETIVMYGNNFGLFGSSSGATRILKRLTQITTSAARVVAGSLDPYATEDPAHLAYHRHNLARGRMPGQTRLRIRHRMLATPWFDYLFVSPEEMSALAASAGWRMRSVISDGAPYYVAVLERAGGAATPAPRARPASR